MWLPPAGLAILTREVFAYREAPLGVARIPTLFRPHSSALALDAADGVIDGRYYGRPIATTQRVTSNAYR